MITQTSSSVPLPLAKIQSIIFLGLGCNSTTLVGCVAVWIILSKCGMLPESFVGAALLVLSFAPIFMSDAINNYVLGRVRLEFEHDWDDILITDKARETTGKLYKAYRALSIIPAYLLAAFFVASLVQKQDIASYIIIAFIITFILQFIRTTSFIQLAIAPVKESFGGKSLIKRSILAIAIFAFIVWRLKQPGIAFSKSFIFWIGMSYFALSAILHPLPTQFFLFQKSKKIRRVYDSALGQDYAILNTDGETEEIYFETGNELNEQQNEEEAKKLEAEDAQIVEETNG